MIRRIAPIVVLTSSFLASAWLAFALRVSAQSPQPPQIEEAKALLACGQQVLDLQKALKIPDVNRKRFLGKVSQATLLCRGGERALEFSLTPWVDWSNYWGAGDLGSIPKGFVSPQLVANRGILGALTDLETQRVALIKFNLFDNSGTYPNYVRGLKGVDGAAIKVWPEMRLQSSNPHYGEVGGDAKQICKGDLIRWRTVTGICNDVLNPAMGSSGMLFMRNVEFESSFPDLGLDPLTKNRHGNRLSLLNPDPQVISRRLFTRRQQSPDKCNGGYGLAGDSNEA